ncbi:MAG: phospholipid carrier-dependent glycosyltransferase [Actinobacteria bacterium]|nr:phospholipid carrier-dependent glycosyltransferase [Actinomycetota bacterium]
MSTAVRQLTRPVLAVALVALVAGGLRFYDLGHPDRYVFDEVYYAKDACIYLDNPASECDLEDPHEQSWVHPPLGKWMIAGGESLFGNGPFGWRVSAALFGTLSVVIVAAMAQLLFGSALWTLLIGLLMATEHLNFVQSRISMLDIFLAFWIVLAFWFLLLDRRWIDRRTPRPAPERPGLEPVEGADPVPARHDPDDWWGEEPGEPAGAHPDPPTGLSRGPGAMAVDEPASSMWAEEEALPDARVPSPLWRPWRFAAGIALGAAAAVKWSAAFGLLAVALLAFIWERTRRKEAGVRHPTWRAFTQEFFGLLIAFLWVPVLAYLLSYLGFLAERGWGWDAFLDLWHRQQGMFEFHFHLSQFKDSGEPSHPYMSRPWTWIILKRPVAYFYEDPGTEILGIGNPVVFWLSVAALPWAAYAWAARKDWRGGLVVLGVAVQYLPWIFFGRPQFLFYMTPVTPFLVLADALFLRDLAGIRPAGARSRPFFPVAVGLVALSVLVFAWMWPVLTAYPLSKDAWSLRIWLPSWV